MAGQRAPNSAASGVHPQALPSQVLLLVYEGWGTHTSAAEMAWPTGYREVYTTRLDRVDSCPGCSWTRSGLPRLSEAHMVKEFNETRREQLPISGVSWSSKGK